MAKRKKPRSAAQKAATARMLAANKRGKSAPKAKAAPRKKKPRSAAQRAATARMLAANHSTKTPARAPRASKRKRSAAPSTPSRTTDRKGF